MEGEALPLLNISACFDRHTGQVGRELVLVIPERDGPVLL